jgi:hypothetical protein
MIRKLTYFTFNFETVHIDSKFAGEETPEKKKDLTQIPHMHTMSCEVFIGDNGVVDGVQKEFEKEDATALRLTCKNRFRDFSKELSGKTLEEMAEFILHAISKLMKDETRPIKVSVLDNIGSGYTLMR